MSGDEFSLWYSDSVTGSYDCVDRIVFNAFFSLGHNLGGFRTWWRWLHGGSDEGLDNTHLMRVVGRFERRVKVWGAAKSVACDLFARPASASTVLPRSVWPAGRHARAVCHRLGLCGHRIPR
ncbi:hypothetical protein [Mycobacterium riyadhense]|uniref:Uncharacterized protein n=1 Tax=Mycobacterium riyadhense TaxID=486698 RepID=A0A1X2B0W9_9MYCO|nr:hypothetical protein [Mycobacterium riyadhense]MCV7147911.1 hypothetical protein [Mycobacterium riyadhense]ORW56979.1 hypothetical protein AWC22_00750 [Mycobacterium riyadhense]